MVLAGSGGVEGTLLDIATGICYTLRTWTAADVPQVIRPQRPTHSVVFTPSTGCPSRAFAFMDYLSLLQQPFLQVKQNPPQSQWAWGRLTITGIWPVKGRGRARSGGLVPFRAVAVSRRGHARQRCGCHAVCHHARETEVDTSEDYQNKVGWLPDPWRLLYLTRGIADRVLACVLVEQSATASRQPGATSSLKR